MIARMRRVCLAGWFIAWTAVIFADTASEIAVGVMGWLFFSYRLWRLGSL